MSKEVSRSIVIATNDDSIYYIVTIKDGELSIEKKMSLQSGYLDKFIISDLDSAKSIGRSILELVPK